MLTSELRGHRRQLDNVGDATLVSLLAYAACAVRALALLVAAIGERTPTLQ